MADADCNAPVVATCEAGDLRGGLDIGYDADIQCEYGMYKEHYGEFAGEPTCRDCLQAIGAESWGEWVEVSDEA